MRPFGPCVYMYIIRSVLGGFREEIEARNSAGTGLDELKMSEEKLLHRLWCDGGGGAATEVLFYR